MDILQRLAFPLRRQGLPLPLGCTCCCGFLFRARQYDFDLNELFSRTLSKITIRRCSKSFNNCDNVANVEIIPQILYETALRSLAFIVMEIASVMHPIAAPVLPILHFDDTVDVKDRFFLGQPVLGVGLRVLSSLFD